MRRVLRTAGWQVELSADSSAAVGWDRESRAGVILHGELLGNPDEVSLPAVAARFRADAEAAARSLNGSFALLVVDRDRDRVLAVTDRVGSRRLFHGLGPDGHWITSDLRGQPRGGRPLDPVGVAWYLANAAVYAGRTPLDGIGVLPRAGIHTLGEKGVQSTEYWSHRVLEPTAPEPPGALTDALAERLVESVRRRVGEGSPVVSLSGGWDSTVILGILVDVLGRHDVRTFSYVAPESVVRRNELRWNSEDRDAAVAARTAGDAGVPHAVVDSYATDLLAHLTLNARLTEGVAGPASEASAWPLLASRFESSDDPVLFAGDQYFGPGRTEPHPTVEDVWSFMFYRGLVLPPVAGSRVPHATLSSMRRGLAEDRARVLARQPPTDDLLTLLGHLNFDHRVANVIVPWRERFPGRWFTVRNPWFDRDVLDFVVAHGNGPRVGKGWFIEAGRRISPLVKRHRPALRDAYHPDLKLAMRKDAATLRAWLRESASPLDALIPPAFGEALLDEVVNRSRLRRSPAYLRHALRSRLSVLPLVTPPASPIPAPTLFMRWAVLRMALAM